MEKKLAQINEAFEHMRFTECLAIIEQTLKKFAKPDKKKQQLSEKDIKAIYCFKVGCLASLGKFHEADLLYDQITDPTSIALFGEQYGLMLTSISELFGENREKMMIEYLDKTGNVNKQSLYRFYLTSRHFSGLSKMFLKEFTMTKNVSMLMGQVYLQYLQCLEKANLIEFKRDGWYQYNQKLKMGLKMVGIFLAKCDERVEDNRIKHENDIKEASDHNKQTIEKQIQVRKNMSQKLEELKLKIAINEGRVLDAIKIFQNIRENIKFPFIFIRSILKLKDISEEKGQIDSFYLRQMSKIFRTNLDFDTYTPWYDYYNQFLWVIVKEAEKVDPKLKENIDIKHQTLPFDKFYVFQTPAPASVFTTYYNSLSSEYNTLTDGSNPSSKQLHKSDYYKISIKGLLLQLLQISSYFNLQQKFIQFLKDYTKYFGKTLTYAHQMKKYWKIIREETIIGGLENVNSTDLLILEINSWKIRLENEKEELSLQGFTKISRELGELYKVRVKEIENNKKLQKGERYISDQFYTLISDYARALIETCQTSDLVLKISNIMVNELEYAIQISPYNADLKLRLMYFCSLLNHHERMNEIYFTNDIKSVQWQSLGYWFIRNVIEFGTNEHYDQFIDKMVKSYQQNQRQTSEYGLKALKAGQLDRVDEYLCYRTCILNSYNSIVILYLLYQKYRFDNNSEYYLIMINERINRFKAGENEITFNADYKVMKNEIFSDRGFGNFYGIFNSFELLHKETQLSLHEHALIADLTDKKNEKMPKDIIELTKLEETINSFEAKNIFDFSRYTFQEGTPSFDPEKSKYTVARAEAYLQNFKLMSKLRILVIQLVSELNRFMKTQEPNKENVLQLKEKVRKALCDLTEGFGQMDYLCQIHSLTMVRRNLFESYNLLFLIREVVSKSKKLKFAKGLVNEGAEQCLQEIMDKITGLRWSPKKQVSASKLVSIRDEQLQKQLLLDHNQTKRLQSRYQSLYKL